eukprot:COSAG02_NODE_628_length_19343_cov_15.829297_11_plen_421_part_00
MEVEEIGDELADLDALEESLSSGMQPGAVANCIDAPESEKNSMSPKAADYSIDGIPDLVDLDALEQSITTASGTAPEPEPEPESEPVDDTESQATGPVERPGFAKCLPECCVRDWWNEEVHPAKEKELAHVFAYFDADGNGSIDKHELRKVIQDLFAGGHVKQPTDTLVASMMEAGDKDGNGLIDFPEFVKLVTSADLNLHPSLCDRCRDSRRERRCFFRQKPGVRCGPPDNDRFDPKSLPHPAFWVLTKTIFSHTAVGVVLLVLAIGADGDVKISSGLSALLIVLASFGLTLAYAGVPANRCLFGLYLLVLVAQICISTTMLFPYIFDEQCTVAGVEVHEACLGFITDYDQVGDAKDACIALKTELGQTYCNFKTDCDLLLTEFSCELESHGTRECTWREDDLGEGGFCNATSPDTACA